MWDFNVVLLILGARISQKEQALCGIDVSIEKTPSGKADLLQRCKISYATQKLQLNNPDYAITLIDLPSGNLLSSYAQSFKGLGTGDDPRYRRYVWEIAIVAIFSWNL